METKPFILICDDYEPIGKSIAFVLEKAGFRAQSVTRALDCVAVARQTRPDLVLMDIMLPGLDGATVSDLLRDIPGLEQVPILLLSAMPEEEVQRRASEVEAGYVLKPFRMYQLIDVVRRCLEATPARMAPAIG